MTSESERTQPASASNPKPGRDDATNFPTETVVHLLGIGEKRRERPIDPVLRAIGRAIEADRDGDPVTEALVRGALESGEQAADLREGRLSIEQILAIKDQSKRAFAPDATSENREAALLGYFVSVASALAHFERKITSQARETLDEILLDLADACREPWKTLFERAVAVPHDGKKPGADAS